MRFILLLAAAAAFAADSSKVINEGYGDFLLVPGGNFKMGDNFGDGEPRERPVHQVHVDTFYIGKFEVTNGDWKKFMNSPEYDDVKLWPTGRVVPKDQNPYWTQAMNHGGAMPGSDNYPVLGVNWDAATAYCNWLSKKTGKQYRLPTEAEWEKAARGTDQRRFPWGNTIDYDHANYAGAQKFDTGKEVATTPRASAPMAPWTWAATSWSGARTGTAAATTRCRPRRIRWARTRAPIAYCAAGRSSLKARICAALRDRAAGPRCRPGA